MASLETGAQFVSFIRQYRAKILQRWEQKVRTLPPASDLGHRALIDHLPLVLDDIADAAEAALEGDESPPLRSDPDRHAIERLHQGYELGHVVTEYSLLRDTILELSEEIEDPYGKEVRIFNRILDRAMQQAVHRYADASQRILNAVDRLSQLAFAEHMSEDALLLALLDLMIKAAPGVDEVSILLCEGDRLYVRQAIGLTTEREANFSLAIGEGFAGTIAATGKPLFIRSAETDPLVKSQFLKDRGFKALYGVPLLDGEVIGVAHMGSLTAYEFADEDMLLFRAMANRATQILVEARLKAELRKEREELRLTLRNAKLGTFVHDIEQDKIEWDERTRELFGVTSAESVDYQRFISLVAPDDRDAVEQAIARARATGEEFQVQYRVVRPDGGERHLVVNGGVVLGGDGRKRLVGVVRDRTAEHNAERERELFLAALGHDLRSPLQAISMGAWSLVHMPSLSESARKTARRVARSSERMTRLIGQLLDFARAAAGSALVIERRRTDLADLWHQVIDEISVGAPDRRVELRVQTDAFGEWDADRMLQVFLNLGWNAVHYGERGRPITVTLTGDSEAVVCEVHNDGRPIPVEVKPKLFAPFRRGPIGHGLGLGLYIAQQVVQAHGGRIDVESSAEAGTTFRVWLPRRAPAPAAHDYGPPM